MSSEERYKEIADELAEALREIRDYIGTTSSGEYADDLKNISIDALAKYDAMKGEE